MMSRQQIKLKAKEDIRGRVFICFLPWLIYAAIIGIITGFSARDTYGSVSTIVYLVLFPMVVGISKIYLEIVNNRNYDIKIGEVFAFYKSFNRIGHILAAYIISGLYIILGTILLIIPGIILALRYSMLPFVLADYDDIGWREALDKCKEITKGRKFEIFVYNLSFIGWFLLGAITAGILYIYVAPYYTATMANLYYHYNPKLTLGDNPQPFYNI
ncbi:MAG TPA: DUF975 family protein [Clostridia bacterium]|nr:DUF975 family protein [Clostridia bacterium]